VCRVAPFSYIHTLNLYHSQSCGLGYVLLLLLLLNLLVTQACQMSASHFELSRAREVRHCKQLAYVTAVAICAELLYPVTTVAKRSGALCIQLASVPHSKQCKNQMQQQQHKRNTQQVYTSGCRHDEKCCCYLVSAQSTTASSSTACTAAAATVKCDAPLSSHHRPHHRRTC
jgi:hypothetical protein